MKIIQKLVLVVTTLVSSAILNALPIVQEWYVPQPEAQLRTDYLVLAPITSTTCDSVIALTVPIVGTKIVFDHWEDGYEADLSNPVQSTTRIWGDGNNANGVPPGYANDPASFTAGSVITMRNNVPLPRNAATILYDGRDRLGSTYGIVMTRAGWFTDPGPLLANSIEVRAVPDWGTSFELPIGEDFIFPTPLTSSMFEHCSAYIQAAANNTVVTIDLDGAGGAAATSVTLNQGESHLVNSGIKTKATITSTKPIQVIEFFGDIGANYESRGANIPPINKWSDDYYAPVGTASDGDDTYIFLHNPDDALAITINWVTKTGTGTFSIPAEGTYQFLMPQNSAARFTSVGERPFWGIGTVGAEPTANNVHDWGYSLVPKDFLSTEIVVGWGAGSDDGTQNGSPVWVTTVGSTKLYVDYNGDRLGSLTDPNGSKYDYEIDVTPLTVTRLFDPDKNQSGMRIYTLNGVLLTGAWGQDPATAGPARPYLDLGNTLPNFPVPVLSKTSTRVVDAVPTGTSLGIGDTLEYTLTLDNRSLFSLSAIGILDTLPTAYVSYVANSTTRDAVAVADSVTGTPFPLDVEGLFVPILQSKASTVIKFRVTITAVGTATNTAEVVGSPGVQASNTVVIPSGGSFTSCAILLTNSSGTETNYTIGDGVYVTVNDADTNTSASTADTLTVVVQNTTTGDTELITLTETLVNNGIFRNTAPLPTSTSTGLGPNDGTLNVAAGSTISASRLDPVFGDTCSDTATVSASSGLSKQLYLDTDGSDGDTAGDLDRVDPVNTADNTTSQSAVVTPLVQSTQTFSTSGTSNWTVPAGVTQVTVKTWGGGGAGGGSTNASGIQGRGGAGGGGGAYATSVLTVTPGQVLSVNVASTASGSSGATGANGSPSFVGPDSNAANAYVRAAGGTGGTGNTAGGSPAGGAGGTVADSIGTTRTAGTGGGNGATGLGISSGAGGAGALPDGGAGGAAIGSGTSAGNPGTAPGGGGGGARTSLTGGSQTGGLGASGQVVISYETPATSVTFTQTPSFAEAFSLTGAPSVTAYYTVTSGTMPGTPSNISAILRKNGSNFATSTSVTASAATGSGSFTFGFPSSSTSFVSTDVISLVISSTQAGVAFTVDYDSSTKPSKITLPTNTVIHADSVTIYDAPYPGGSVVTTPTVGQTLYVRSVVGDPFGFADVTSANVVIDGATTSAGDIASTAMTPVAGSGANRTFEYVWVTGSTEDTFSITVTAKEGYENTITSTKATSIPLTALDLGTPSTTEFTTGNNGPHTLTYSPNETIYVRVIDFDENADPLVVETVTVVILGSGGDSETITLTETGPNTGIFTGGVPASSTVPGTSNNGTLYAILGSIPVVNYVDNDDALDTGSDTALIPNTVANVSVTKTLLTDNPILIGEAVQYRLRVTNTGNLTLNTVQVVDTYPSDKLTFVSATPSPDSSPAGTLTWTNIGSLVAGASADIIVNFTGSAAAAPATNTVNVTTTTTGGANPSASDTEPVTITRPGVTVTKTLDPSTPGPVNKGDNVVFNISVQNTGTTAITNLPLEDLYSDALFEYVSATPSPDGVGAGSLLWNDLTGAGSLAVNATLNVTVTLKAKGASTTATNLAAVNYAEDENGDPVPPDDDPAEVTTVAASISGYVYEDVGTAGFGGGDTALAGVTLGLYRFGFGPDGIAGNGDDSDPVALTTTSATGYYEFLNLGLGNYVVQETDLTGYRSIDDTSSDDPSPGAIGDVQDSDNAIAVAVSTFTAHNTNNFLDDVLVLSDYGTITGQVRNDTDADGNLADSESGIGGVTIYLYTDPNGDGDPSDGTVLQTTTTATSGSVGSYTFNYVPYGAYVVVESDPLGYVSTRDGDTVTPDAGGSPADATNVGNDNRIPVNVAGSELDSGNDFLDTTVTSGLGSIGNLVWVDSDRDGIKDSGESGVDGVLVQLFLAGQDPLVDAPYMATTTSGGGLYSFTNALAGSYFVYLPASNFAPGAVLNTAPTSSPVTNTNDDGIDNDDNGIQAGGSGTGVSSPTIVLSALESDTTKDFGFAPNLISGTVRRDIVPDSTLNGTEPGIAGVVVELRDGNGDLIATTTTDSAGDYQFDGIPSGNYRVVMLTPVGGTAVDDADDNTGGNGFARVDVTMVAADITTRDFLVETTALKKIAGTLYDDKDLDGVFDTPPTDTYRAGSTVQLYRDLNGDSIADPGELIGSDISDVNGYYEFADLPAGAYLVKVVRSNRCFFVNERGGTSPELGAIDDGMMVVNLAAADDTNNDFLLCRGIFLGAIGDYVWVDEDSDGNQDAGEPGLANVTVRLYAADGTTLLAETVTDTEGKYLFPNRINGDYVVKVDSTTMPAGLAVNPTYDLDGTSTAHESAVTMAFGQFRRDVDFGYNWATTAAVTGGTGTGAIGNRIWIDSDGDGVRDLTEAGLGGVPVAIYYDSNGDGVVDSLYTLAVDENGSTGTGTTTTDEDGSYIFDNLPAGIYEIVVNGGAPPSGGYTQTGDPDPTEDNRTTTPIILAPGDVYLNADFGYQPATSSDLSGVVYFDYNANSNQDGSDAGVAGVSVALLDASGNVIATSVTDANGAYSFNDLPAGNYTVWINDTARNLGGRRQTEDQDVVIDSRHTVTLNGTTNTTGIDFGYTPSEQGSTTALIGDTIFLDRDGDGSFDAGEGMRGVTVYLYAADGITRLDETETDANGNYYFGGRAAGTYVVEVVTSTLPGTAGQLTNTVDPDTVSPGNSRSTVTITSGQINLDQDFGYRDLTNPNIIEGTLWNDLDADGTLDGGEAGRFAGVIMVLLDANGDEVGRTTTDSNGYYAFTGLPDGTFTVDVVDRDNVVNGYWHPHGTVGVDGQSQTDPYTVAVSGGNTYPADFGYYLASPGLGNRVWNDIDADGIQESGEPGLPGVLVRLTITWPNATTTVVTTVTNGSGYYSFADLLLDESYDGTGGSEPTFSISIPTLPGTASPTGVGTAATDSNTPAGTAATVVMGATDETYDFGFSNLDAGTATLSGIVYDDGGFGVVGNGSFIGGTPDATVPGVLVKLYYDLNGDGIAQPGEYVTETRTDGSGAYSFATLPNGPYLVIETDPSGASSVTDTDGLGNGPNLIAVTLSGGADSTNNNFLDDGTPTTSLSGFVYDDNGFGIVGNGGFGGSPADAPIGGVVVKIYADANNDGIAQSNELMQTTSTDGTGYYTFSNLPAGNYLVVETDPSGASSVTDTDGNGNGSSKIAATVAGTPVTNQNFLDDGTSVYSISGTVYDDGGVDTVGNGAFGGAVADTGISGVTVSLYSDLNNNGIVDSGDVLIDTKTTSGAGLYTFTNVPNGNYLVVETDPDAFASLTDIGEPDANNDDNTIDVTLNNASQTDQNFLDAAEACPDTWLEWQNKWDDFVGAPNVDYSDNPDGDRYNNLLEYAFCMPPNSGVKKPFCLEPSLTVSGGIDGVFRRTAGGTTDVVYTLERSAALGNPTDWTTLTPITLNAGNTTVTINADGTETVRIVDLETKTGLTGGEGFVRMRATISGGTSTTEVLGWTETALNQTCSTFNNPYLRCSTFTGTVSSVSGQDVVFGVSEDFDALLAAGESYYLEVTSGENEGHRFDVVSAIDNKIVVANDSDLYAATAPYNTITGAPPASLPGDTVVLRRHWQLGVQFPVSTAAATGFAADTTPTINNAPDADQVQLYTNGAWVTYYVYDADGTGVAAPFWTLLDGAIADKATTVLPPGQGMFVSRPNPSIQMLSYGEVRENDFIRPLQSGATAALRNNLVGGGFPIDQSANDSDPSPYLFDREMNLTPTVVNGFFGSRDFKTADSFFIWKGDTNGITAGYDSYYLLSRPNTLTLPADNTVLKWVIVGDAGLTSKDADLLFKSDRSVFIRVASPLPLYTIPCPWTNPAP